MPVPQQIPDPIDAFQALHFQLKRALLATTDLAAAETIRQADAVILDAITALNQADFHARTAEFQALTESVNIHLKELTNLKDSLDRILSNVTLAANLTSALDAAVSAAATAFP